MKKEKHYPAEHALEKFHCPHCGVFAKQFWAHLEARYIWKYSSIDTVRDFSENLERNWTISKCEHCSGRIIWLDEVIVYPRKILVAQPNDDLNEDIKNDYLEAAAIFNDSARASAALLRLALQKLCKQLGENGKNINDDIGSLVKKGLSSQIQKSLDILRITGNNAVHPGEINLEESPEVVLKLFDLVNFIAEKMITEPKELDGFYEGLPDGVKEQIEKRDEDK